MLFRSAQVLKEVNSDEPFYSPGFALGSVDDEGQPHLNNHYDIAIDYHKSGPNEFRVVGVLVDPFSMRGSKVSDDGKAECGVIEKKSDLVTLSDSEDTTVAFTYSVYWIESPTPFATRWDKYLHVYDPKIHWFSLINSAVIVVFLIGMVSTILVRTLRKDIARYNRLDQLALDDFGANGAVEDGIQDDSGWKLVHGDVFRPPKNPLLLSILIGNGAQVFMMAGLTIGKWTHKSVARPLLTVTAFALLGFLSPSNRGALGTVIIILYTVFGFIGGYVSARVYKFFNGEAWKLNFFYTPVALPSIIFGIFFLLNQIGRAHV